MIILAVIGAVFVSDTITDREIATAVFYIVAVLLAVGCFPSRSVILIAGLCLMLTVLSFALSKSGSREAGIVNCAISISAIMVTTFIALKMVSAETAAHEARAQVIRMARVNSLGEVATSIAHEVNQPLSAIVTSGNACLRWLAATPPNIERARLAVERGIHDAARAGTIIDRIREHARGRPPERRLLAVDRLIRDSVAMWDDVINRSGVALRLAVANDLPPVRGDSVQLQQVVGNLILNAIEAMGSLSHQGGALTITAFADEADVGIAVEDDGPGIDADHLPHVFESFWTTKQHGTGIGLAISRSIIEAHGGAIGGERLKPGTRFWIRLPAQRSSPA